MTNEAAYLRRAYASLGRFQWAREYLQNAIEANAARVEFGIEWQAVALAGVYRRTVIDDGAGMTARELLTYFGSLGESGKTRTAGVHDNFGLGAKLSSLPWNPDGVVVVTRKAGVSAMVRMQLDPTSGDYELAEIDVDGVTRAVLDPDAIEWEEGDVDWSTVLPEWVGEHGTAVVFLGDTAAGHPHTVLGAPGQGEEDIKGLSTYLNSRFWSLPESVDVRVFELRGRDPETWPKTADDVADGRPNVRHIRGAQYYVEHGARSTKGGALASSGTVHVGPGGSVAVSWYLWEGARPQIHSYALRHGYTAVRYKSELFGLTAHSARYRAFGITPRAVQSRLTLIIEPPLYYGEAGVHPDDARQSLRWTDAETKATELPVLQWAHEFAENMPPELLAAVAEATDVEGSVDDERYREALIQRYGDRWRRKVLVAGPGEAPHTQATDAGSVPVLPSTVRREPEEGREVVEREPAGEGDDETEPAPARKRIARHAKAGARGREATQPGSIPRFEWLDDAVGDEPWHLAAWSRHHPSRTPTVQLSTRSTLYRDTLANFTAQYAPVHEARVRSAVQRGLGQIVVCKAAHVCALAAQGVSEETIDELILTPASLTVALMGFIAEEGVIERLIGPIAKRKVQA